MKLNTLRALGCRYLLPMLAPLCAVVMGACDVTQPDRNPWEDVRAFSWPANKVLKYQVYNLATGSPVAGDSIEITTKIASPATAVYWNGERFYEMKQRRNNDPADNARPLFLPLRDTLVMRGGDFRSDLALVAPLAKGHSWSCGLDTVVSSAGDVIVPWQATILERYSYRKVEGVVYTNVIEVEYRPEFVVGNNAMEIWTRFYAEGKGVIQTIRSYVPRPARPEDPPAIPKPTARTVLVETRDAVN